MFGVRLKTLDNVSHYWVLYEYCTHIFSNCNYIRKIVSDWIHFLCGNEIGSF